MRNVIIPPTTAAVNHILDMSAASKNAIIQVDTNIGAGEAVGIEQQNTNDMWGDLYSDNVLQELTSGNTQVLVLSINRLRIVKSITASPIGVTVIT